jgi:dTDP-4-dehydrorhamnose 3,5-epimerase
MHIETFEIEGLLAFVPPIFKDNRGQFFESFNQKRFNEITGSPVNFVQDNQSISGKNVLRGLHFQAPPFAQGKLVRVSKGAVIDVAVDIRKESKTYGKSQSILLSQENNKVFWIPEGFAHGFYALEDKTIFNYKCTNYYDKESEGALNWNDKDLNIDWQGVKDPVLSEKDLVDTKFSNFISPF